MSECTGPGCTHAEHQDDRDPIVKYDGHGQPVRASQLADLGLNRAERRAQAREARRQARQDTRLQRAVNRMFDEHR